MTRHVKPGFRLVSSTQAFIAAEQEASTWQFALAFTNNLAAGWAFVWSQTGRVPMCIRIISAALVVCVTIGVAFLGRVSGIFAPKLSCIPLAVFLFFLILGLCLLQCRCWSKDEVPEGLPMSVKAAVADDDSDSFSI